MIDQPDDAVPPGPVDIPRPIQLTVSDDLRRSRWTVAFRLILAIPHLVFLTLWGFAAFLVAVVVWFAILFEGRAPRTLHGFIASYVRYGTHVWSYIAFLANPYPGFTGSDSYPVDVTIAGPERQRKWGAAFRLFLALPALALGAGLAGGFAQTATSADKDTHGVFTIGGVLAVIAVLGWFASLVRGAMPRGLRDLGAYAVGYGAQTTGYLLLLTDRYPTSDPTAVQPAQDLPQHPVRIVVDDGLERSRLTVFFRLLLAIPHLIWLVLWAIVAVVTVFVAWLVALVIGRVPLPFHRFLAAFVRYAAHVYSFLFLIGGPFPGFVGAANSYPVDLQIDGPVPQRRLVTLFRGLLAVPAILLGGALTGVLYIVALLAWWYALVTGRMPEGLRNLGASCIRYSAQLDAYLLLVTPRYPYAAPALVDRPRPPEEDPALVPVGAPPSELEGGAEAEAEPA